MPTDKEVGIRRIPAYTLHYTQSRRQSSTDGGAAEVTKGGDDVAQSKNK